MSGSKGAPLLITGAAGFIGARYVESCNQQNQPILSVDSLACFTDRQEHQGLQFGTRIDRSDLLDFLQTERPPLSGIVHLGACTDTTEMDEALLRRVNLEYSQSLWNYASQHKIRFVYASSAATYGDGNNGYDDSEAEISTLNPLNPYGWSKQHFDLWALEQEKTGNHPPSWSGFKFFNVYGFGEAHKGRMASIVYQAFRQISESGSVKLFRSHRADVKDGFQKRDFVSVDDCVRVLDFALKTPLARGIYNLGTGTARSFLDAVNLVFAAMKRPPQIVFIDTPTDIRTQYQYFTQAKMDRLGNAGYSNRFLPLEKGIPLYMARLQNA